MKALHSLTPKVSESVFVAVLWGGLALSLFFLMFRFYVRIKSFRKLYADDYIVIVAWLMFLATAITWQTHVQALYRQFGFTAQSIVPTPTNLAAERALLRSEVPLVMLFYTCLWAVKLSFLLFFRRLGQQVRGQKFWWWCVFGVTVATWVTSITTIQWNCNLKPVEYVFSQCGKPDAIRFERQTFIYNLCVDIITDALIITIPVLMLWNVEISLGRKLGLIALFSLTIIVIVFAIVRVALVLSFSLQPDVTWLYLWNHIEITVSLVVSTLGSFRQLFVKNEQARNAQPGIEHQSTTRRLFSTFGSKAWSAKSGQSNARSELPWMDRHRPAQSDTSAEHIMPLERIHVGHKIGVSIDPITEGGDSLEALGYGTHSHAYARQS